MPPPIEMSRAPFAEDPRQKPGPKQGACRGAVPTNVHFAEPVTGFTAATPFGAAIYSVPPPSIGGSWIPGNAPVGPNCCGLSNDFDQATFSVPTFDALTWLSDEKRV